MSGDEKHDPRQSETKSRAASARPGNVTARMGCPIAHEGEFEAPTRPRARTLDDSEAPPDSRVDADALRAPQDSFHPVRVPARSSRPPVSLWTRAWATIALVIVMIGGAIGIVASLSARALTSGQGAPDPSQGAAVSPSAERKVEGSGIGMKALPAAAPALAAPPPMVPSQGVPPCAAPCMVTSPAFAVARVPASAEVPASAFSANVVAPKSASSVAFRTLDSLAISPPPASPSPPSAAASSRSRPKPAEAAARSSRANGPLENTKERSTETPGNSDLPGTKADSEAWITEERRF